MTEIKLDPPLEIDFKGNPKLVKFRTLDDVNNFVTEELTTWDQLFPAAKRAALYEFVKPQVSALQTMVNEVAQQKQAAKDDKVASAPFNDILAPFINRHCVHSESALGVAILETATRSSFEAAGMFLGAIQSPVRVQLSNVQGQPLLGPLLRGAARACLVDAGYPPATKRERERLGELIVEAERISNSQKDALIKFENDAATRFEKIAASFAEFQNNAASLYAEVRSTIDKAKKQFVAQQHEHAKIMQALQAAYREDMQLRAPREYWAAKMQRHKVNAKRWSLAFWAGCASVLLAVAIFGGSLVHFIAAAGTQAGPADWLLFVVPTVIVLWTLRFLHRQATTNLALMSDADERVTMVETYLALQAEGKIEAIERPLVLQPLFRPSTATGDEGVTKSLVDHVIDALSKK